MEWEITFYKSPSGQPVVQKFIDALPEISRTRIARNIDLLERYGTQLGMPHARPMGGGLLELRVRGKAVNKTCEYSTPLLRDNGLTCCMDL
jgi:phage-related protein